MNMEDKNLLTLIGNKLFYSIVGVVIASTVSICTTVFATYYGLKAQIESVSNESKVRQKEVDGKFDLIDKDLEMLKDKTAVYKAVKASIN